MAVASTGCAWIVAAAPSVVKLSQSRGHIFDSLRRPLPCGTRAIELVLCESPHASSVPPASPRSRFYAGYTWLILRNALGWGLIGISLVAGPLVPGPGGTPLFLIGFALVSFPGKRRLTARVLRGRPLRFRAKLFSMIVWVVALAGSIATLTSTRPWAGWPIAQPIRTVAVVGVYIVGTLVAWLALQLALRLTNALLRLVPRARYRVRPWLRRHGIRLLPPRWRRRHAHERGSGPHRLKEEILKLGRRA